MLSAMPHQWWRCAATRVFALTRQSGQRRGVRIPRGRHPPATSLAQIRRCAKSRSYCRARLARAAHAFHTACWPLTATPWALDVYPRPNFCQKSSQSPEVTLIHSWLTGQKVAATCVNWCIEGQRKYGGANLDRAGSGDFTAPSSMCAFAHPRPSGLDRRGVASCAGLRSLVT